MSPKKRSIDRGSSSNSSSSSSSSSSTAAAAATGATPDDERRRSKRTVATEMAAAKKEEEDEEKEEALEFEDEWSDEYEEEDVINPMDEDAMSVDEADDATMTTSNRDVDEAAEDEGAPPEAFIPGRHQLGPNEVLEPDHAAYDMLHSLSVEWPCLSFDILRDSLGNERRTYPMTAYVVAGTQADKVSSNQVLVMKLSQLCRTKHRKSEESDSDDDDDDDDDDNDDVEDDPILEYHSVKHHGGVNRIRLMPQNDVATVAATFSDTGEVHLFDLSQQVKALDVAPLKKISSTAPSHTCTKHSTEGYALDWSRQVPGRLLSGDCKKFVFLTSYQNGSWQSEEKPYVGHTDSVEDIQWSPYERDVFASCSVDKTVRIWDARKKSPPALTVQAHNTDVNVISWSRIVSYLLVSGADDGSFRVWDLRHFKSGVPVSQFTWHKEPITTLEWHPSDESVLAVGASDDQLTIWDFSVEKDTETGASTTEDDVDVPPQLLFIHQGQSDLKELHWHPQIPGVMVSTASSGFNIFKTISV